MQNSKLIHILVSCGAAFALWVILIIFADLFEGFTTIQRIFELFGGSFGGYIQALTFAAFFFGILQLNEKQKFINEQYKGFKYNLLPTQEQLVISPDDVAKIKLDVIDLERKGFKLLVLDFIKKACTQYRNDQSVGETLQVLDTQINNSKNELEGRLEMVRYMINAIASLGFIGTVIGLSQAIGLSHLAKTEEGMPEITRNMYVAFDTTLVALLLGLVLNFFYHRYLEDIDTFYSKSKGYIIDNLISRIYKG